METYRVMLPGGKSVDQQVPDGADDASVRAAFKAKMQPFGYNVQQQAVLRPKKPDPQQYWQSALANQGSLSTYHPSISENVQTGLASGLHALGVGSYADRFAQRAMAPLNDWTPLGNAQGIQDGARMATRGDLASGVLGAGLMGLNMLPFGGGAIKREGGHLLGNLLRDESGAIRAWHGSPHDFDKFDISKIGTGEGAQAYGHGLYFAENPAVAQQYQNILGFKHTGAAPKVDWGNDPASSATHWLLMHNGDRSAATQTFETIKAQQQRIADRATKGLPMAPGAADHAFKEIRNADEAIAHIRNGTEAAPPNPGHLYEVNINAEPHDFLNWDAPQSADPRLTALGLQPKPWRGNPDGPPPDLYYRGLTDNPETFDKLRQGGIPGIRYLDQGSRGTGVGTSNYVVFDPSLIDILNKH